MEPKETDDRAFKFSSKPDEDFLEEDFLDEENHSRLHSHPAKKDSFGAELTKLFEEIPLAWLGVGGLLVIIVLVLFLFSRWDGVDKGKIPALEKRLANLENKVSVLENISDGITRMNQNLSDFDKLKKRMDGMEAILAARMDRIEKQAAALEKRAAQTGSQKSAATKTGATVQKEARKTYHTVAPGETLYGISRKYGLSVDDLKRLNTLDGKTEIQPGQKLLVTP